MQQNSDDGTERLLSLLRGEGDHDEVRLSELSSRLDAVRARLVAQQDDAKLGELAEALSNWSRERAPAEDSEPAMMLAATLAEQAGDVELACDLCERVLQQSPSHTEAMDRLTALLTPMGDFARLESARMEQVSLLASHAPLEYELRIQALSALAELRARKLHDLDTAIDAYQEALEIEPLDATMEALAALHLERDQPGDPDDAAELFFRLGEHLPPEQARPWLERALDCNPAHEGALVMLQELAQVAPEGVDTERLQSRLLTFASVAPASERRDSVIESLRAQGSEVPDFESPAPLKPETASWDTVPARPAARAKASAARALPPQEILPPPDSLAPVAAPTQPGKRAQTHNALGWAGLAGLAVLMLIGALSMRDAANDAEPTAASKPETTRAEPLRQARPTAEPPTSTAEPSAGSREPAAAPPPQTAKPAATSAAPRAAAAASEQAAPSSSAGAILVKSLVRAPARVDQSEVFAALTQVQQRLDRCYDHARHKSPRLQGLVEYTWTVRPNGRVLRVRSLSDSLHAPSVRTCGLGAIRKTRFPRYRGKRAVELRAVFDFAPPQR